MENIKTKTAQIVKLMDFSQRWDAMENDNGIDELTKEHQAFCDNNNLPQMCADELAMEIIVSRDFLFEILNTLEIAAGALTPCFDKGDGSAEEEAFSAVLGMIKKIKGE